MDDDLGEVLRGFEAHFGPTAAAIFAAVDAVAKADMPTADVLTGAEPDDLGVGGVEGDAAGGVDALTIEDRLPGRARVDRLPDPTRTHCDIPDAGVRGMDGDVGDPAGHEGRADIAQLEPLESFGGHAGVFALFGGNCADGQHERDNGQRDGDSLHVGPPWRNSGSAVIQPNKISTSMRVHLHHRDTHHYFTAKTQRRKERQAHRR